MNYIDRYKVHEVLARGATGSVYRAWDPKLHREVAIKVVYRDVALDKKNIERFHREARAVAALKHPNIVEIYDYSGHDADVLFLVMELLDGQDLYEYLAKWGPMPEPLVAAVGHEICGALHVAHEAGVIHRDVKPENVVLTATGRIVITDFGGVKAFQTDSAVMDRPQQTEIVGTPGFMAPEQIRSNDLGPYTDIFALGALLYNISTGALPFGDDAYLGALEAALNNKMKDPRHYIPALSTTFCLVLQRCLKPYPSQRFASAQEMRTALKQVLSAHHILDVRDDLGEYARNPNLLGGQKTVANVSRPQPPQKGGDRATPEPADSVESTKISLPGLWLRVRNAPAIVRSHLLPRRHQRRWIPFAAAAGLLLAAALGIALAIKLRRRSNAEVSVDVIAAPALPAARNKGKLLLDISGGPALVMVDGKREGRWWQGGVLDVRAGRHVVEIRGRGKRLRAEVNVSPREMATIYADLRHGTIKTGKSHTP